MLIHDGPHPPSQAWGRIYVDHANWLQLAPDQLDPGNPNIPFPSNDRVTPYQELALVGLWIAENLVKISFDVDIVDLGSLDAVLDFLSTTHPRTPCRLEYYKEGWMVEHVVTGRQAVVRIRELMTYRGVPLISRSIVQPQQLDALAAGGNDLLRTCYHAWTENNDLDLLDGTPIASKLIAFETDSEGVLRYHHIGASSALAQCFGGSWRDQAIGQATTTMLPDIDYHDATARGIRAALDNGSARYDLVLASVDLPEKGREWAAYARLNVPSRGRLVGAVVRAPHGDLGLPFLRPR